MSVDISIEESKLLAKSISTSSINKDTANLEKFALIRSDVDSSVNRTERPASINLNDLEQNECYYETNPAHCDAAYEKDREKVEATVENKECSCNSSETRHKKLNKNPNNHLYPKVVVNVSNELSDVDSDEEDYNLRTFRKNDSGQGSSVETSSLKSNHTNESYQTTTPEGKDCSNSLPEENCISDENVIDDFQDIDLSSEDKLAVFRGTNFSSRCSPDSYKRIQDSIFTDVPLDGSVNAQLRPLNTYAPRKLTNSNLATQNILQKKFKAPMVTDIQPKASRLLKGATPKSWKIFGKVAIPISKNLSPRGSPGSKKKGAVVASTTALIFENRPFNLPQKSAKEEQKHREQYEEMIQASRKKELREKEIENKKMKETRKLEDQLSSTVKIWKYEIIPDWENCKNSKKVRELWWHGIPPSVRGVIWNLAIGNNLNMTKELFEIFLTDAKERLKTVSDYNILPTLHNGESSLIVSKENTLGLIALDVSRTFPSLCIFQKGGPYHEPLKYLLAAYTCHRPDVGYVQGMSFLAAVLLLNMDLPDAFICFANLLNGPCQMAFFMVDQPMMDAYFRTFDVLLDDQIPRLHLHFKQECLSHDIYLIDWIFTLFSKSLPLDTACRVWDLFCRDGEEFLFKTALGILLMYEDLLLEMEFFRLAQYLTKLSNTITADLLFQQILKINIPKHKFQQTLSNFKMIAKSNPPPT